jgi:1,4-alpha-glucan branching enzyme
MKEKVDPIDLDPYLRAFADKFAERAHYIETVEHRLTEGRMRLEGFAAGHEYFGMHLRGDEWIFREWAPNATRLALIGDFNNWRPSERFEARRVTDSGDWELRLPEDYLRHGQRYRLLLEWPGGGGERVPTHARRVVYSDAYNTYNAQIWHPPEPHQWRNGRIDARERRPLIYEAHVGIASEEPRVAGYREFADRILPRIASGNYNTVQLMAIQEHPYYGSFGYHVSSFYAPSSRFGTPDDFKYLVDRAHELGLAVVIDLVHSHAVRNEVEGLGLFDGTRYQYFHEGKRGYHTAWDSYCFDYGKPEVLHFLLSNCRYWLDEFRIDGFRFDGITSMLYTHHGLGTAFGSYDDYFKDVDADALAYLALANKLVHTVNPKAVTIAEDVSGMPLLTASAEQGGCGFDYRLAMGIPDYWFEVLETRDEDWGMGELCHRLTDHRPEESVVNYAESHDQAIVGGKTVMFHMADAEMYSAMHRSARNLRVARAVALHKMIRLATLAGGGSAYLNFMGNEFGHPEWLDFPREGNGWSYHYARRQWSLADNPELLYHDLARFDRDMLAFAAGADLLSQAMPDWKFANEGDNVVAWMRGDYLFVFNWHPDKSFTAYPIPAPAGRYRLIFDSDRSDYGGHERLTPRQILETIESDGSALILLYLPTRSALALQRMA